MSRLCNIFVIVESSVGVHGVLTSRGCRKFCDDAQNLQFWFQMTGKDVTKDGNALKFKEGKIVFEDNVKIDGEDTYVLCLK